MEANRLVRALYTYAELQHVSYIHIELIKTDGAGSRDKVGTS